MFTFYVSDPVHSDAISDLSDMGVVHRGYGEDAVSYSSIAADVDAILLRAESFTADMINSSPKLRIIARHGVGTDNVDLTAAAERGIWVTTTPGSNSRAVAEHVFALLLSLARKTPAATVGVADGRWADLKPSLNGVELGGLTLGLIGFGNIARIVGDIGRAFGMTVVVSDPFVPTESVNATGAQHVALEKLIEIADVVSLHIPLTEETTNLIDADVLQAMRPNALLINTSRGGLIDESALADALELGKLGGAALDVLSGESVDMKNPLPHSALAERLSHLPNLVITPHIAGQTDKAFASAGRTAVQCIRQALANHTPDHAVADCSAVRAVGT